MKMLAHNSCIDIDDWVPYQLDQSGRALLLLYPSFPDNKSPIIVVSDAENQPEYTDISTIKNWSMIGEFLGKDYLYVRERIREILVPKTFEACNDDEKLIVCKLFLASPAQRSTVFTQEEEKKHWDDLASAAKASREKRWEAARRKVSFYLSPAEGLDLYTSTRDLSFDYKDASAASLVLWVTNESDPALGIDCTTSGFSQKPYYTTELRDLIVDILVNGNY